MQSNALGQKFTFSRLMRFSTPTMIMMIFMSLYQMVDGVFISNQVGELGLTALNVVYPFTCVVMAVSIMLATGASAIIALNMGQEHDQDARENFTFIVFFGILFSIVLVILGLLFIDEMLAFLGATPRIYQLCYDYLQIMVLATPFAVLQMLFQTFFVTAGKPKLGLTLTAASGIANIILDILFVMQWNMGVRGAALATAIGYGITAVFGLLYFACQRKGHLYFVQLRPRWITLRQTCMNGMSEMINNLAVAITTLMFNIVGLRYLQEEGIAAISIVLYAQFIMTSVFMGYASGVAPVFSYKYGARDKVQIHRIFRMSIYFITGLSVIVFLLAFPLAKPIALVFASHNDYVLNLAIHGFFLFSISFLFTGLNIFASALFTAFSNGVISGLLSFLRTFVFLMLALLFLPNALGSTGIWLAVPLAEGLAFLLSIGAMYFYRHTYFLSIAKE